MPSQLQAELKQNRPFSTLEEEALVSIAVTSARFNRHFAEFLKPYGVTPTQYNVLRILKGAGKGGLCRHEIGDRLINDVPDVTRLLDRMEEHGLVERSRATDDRRLVRTTISREGSALLAALEKPLAKERAAQIGHLGEEKLAALIDLLSEARRPK